MTIYQYTDISGHVVFRDGTFEISSPSLHVEHVFMHVLDAVVFIHAFEYDIFMQIVDVVIFMHILEVDMSMHLSASDIFLHISDTGVYHRSYNYFSESYVPMWRFVCSDVYIVCVDLRMSY